MANIDPSTGLPLVGQPQVALACGLAIALEDNGIAKLKEYVRLQDAKQKCEVFIRYNDQVAMLTFEAFINLVFPPLNPPTEIDVDRDTAVFPGA